MEYIIIKDGKDKAFDVQWACRIENGVLTNAGWYKNGDDGWAENDVEWRYEYKIVKGKIQLLSRLDRREAKSLQYLNIVFRSDTMKGIKTYIIQDEL